MTRQKNTMPNTIDPKRPALSLTKLGHAAERSGFDLERGTIGPWLAFESSQVPLRVWLQAHADGAAVAVSQPNVAHALAHEAAGLAVDVPLPAGAVAARGAAGLTELVALLRRAFALSRTLPDALLKDFEGRTASLPRSTEVERWVVERVGQDVFRGGLLDYWEGRCAVTGLGVPELLRASHIKPWADCASDAERLDVFNGLLLAAHLDTVFDQGLVTFSDAGEILFAEAFPADARALLGVHAGMRLRRVEPPHRAYLPWHRARVFRRA